MNSKLSTLLSIVCSIGIVNTCQAEPGYFLLGVAGGYSAARSNVDATVRYLQPNVLFSNIPPTTALVNYTDGGFTGSVITGYEARCENWLLGGELSFSWDNYNDLQTFAFSDVSAAGGGPGFGWNGSYRYKRDVAVEFALRFGYELESLMLFFPPVFIPYVRFGVQTSKDIIEATYNGDPAVYPYSTSSTFRRWPYRFVAGVGTEFPVIPELALRFEYNYRSSGQNLETTGYINDGLIINPSFTTAMNPIIQSGTMSLVWYFK